MYVSHLQLADYRSYESVYLELEPGTAMFVGANGEGKTNLVEALGYLASLSSHRVATDTPLIRKGAERAVVRAAVNRGEQRAVLELEINSGRANRARLNRAPATRPREILGVLRTVLFAPEDLTLVKGDPAERRQYLDDLLVARAPRFAGVRTDYERIVKQRNALLKSASAQFLNKGKQPDLATLDVWDEQLATAGAELLAARAALVAELQPLVAGAYEELAAAPGPAVLRYACSAVPEDAGMPHDVEGFAQALRAALRSSRNQELQRGVGLVGPHRDDLQLRLGDLPTKGYASQGEAWSYALALRLASFELLRADGDDPVLILDDVFSELDAARRRRLANRVQHAEQVLVSAAVADDIPDELHGTRFRVEQGGVTRD